MWTRCKPPRAMKSSGSNAAWWCSKIIVGIAPLLGGRHHRGHDDRFGDLARRA